VGMPAGGEGPDPGDEEDEEAQEEEAGGGGEDDDGEGPDLEAKDDAGREKAFFHSVTWCCRVHSGGLTSWE
jgi:hypothetical protein